MSVLSKKVPIQKKAGNLLYAPRTYYIFAHSNQYKYDRIHMHIRRYAQHIYA